MTKGCPGAKPSLVGVVPKTVGTGPAGEARVRPWRLSGPLELPGLMKGPPCIKVGPLVGVEAPLLGPGVGLNAMGLIRAFPCKKQIHSESKNRFGEIDKL